MGEITRLLDEWGKGDPVALKSLMPLVYAELRAVAASYLRRERRGHTLQPTALVHEAYLRLASLEGMRFTSRTHFYGAAARVMRRVLVDSARRRRAAKRGGANAARITLEDSFAPPQAAERGIDLLALDEALDALAAQSPACARVVELRYFGGLSVADAADVLDVAPATVKRHWTFSRAWLYRRLAHESPP